MKKSIAIFATVSLLSISASTFAFAETNTGKMMKPETTKMEIPSPVKKMEGEKGVPMIKSKTTKHKHKTTAKKMDDKKIGEAATIAH